jgi:hypothetical protein
MTAMRASTGIRFKAKLQPIQPARLAVDESGFPPSPQASVDRSFDDEIACPP